MTKTKVIRLLNELAEKYGGDLVVMELLDKCKRELGWYQNKRLPDSECLYRNVTLQDLIDGTSTENWSPNDLRDTIKKLQKGNLRPEQAWVRPEESEKELAKYIEEHKEECEKREQEARRNLARYLQYAKPYLEMKNSFRKRGIKI